MPWGKMKETKDMSTSMVATVPARPQKKKKAAKRTVTPGSSTSRKRRRNHEDDDRKPTLPESCSESIWDIYLFLCLYIYSNLCMCMS